MTTKLLLKVKKYLLEIKCEKSKALLLTFLECLKHFYHINSEINKILIPIRLLLVQNYLFQRFFLKDLIFLFNYINFLLFILCFFSQIYNL